MDNVPMSLPYALITLVHLNLNLHVSCLKLMIYHYIKQLHNLFKQFPTFIWTYHLALFLAEELASLNTNRKDFHQNKGNNYHNVWIVSSFNFSMSKSKVVIPLLSSKIKIVFVNCHAYATFFKPLIPSFHVWYEIHLMPTFEMIQLSLLILYHWEKVVNNRIQNMCFEPLTLTLLDERLRLMVQNTCFVPRTLPFLKVKRLRLMVWNMCFGPRTLTFLKVNSSEYVFWTLNLNLFKG